MLRVLARWTAWTVGSVLAALALLLSPVLLWLLYLWVIEPPVVPLTAGLSGTWQAMGDELDRRVKASFPLDSREADMEAQLQQQGFLRQEDRERVGQEHVAARNEDSFPCAKSAFVFWQADSEGRLISVRGIYPMGQCL